MNSPQLHHSRWTWGHSHLKFKHSILWRQFFSRGNAESSITWSSLLWWQGKENVNPRGKVAPLRPMYSRKSEMQHTMWSKSWNMQMKYAVMSSFTWCTGNMFVQCLMVITVCLHNSCVLPLLLCPAWSPVGCCRSCGACSHCVSFHFALEPAAPESWSPQGPKPRSPHVLMRTIQIPIRALMKQELKGAVDPG